MSVRTPAGLKAEPEVLPSERDALVAKLFDQWAGGDAQKLRRLAAGYLWSSRWTLEMIAAAIRCSKGEVSRMLAQLSEEFRGAFQPPAPPPSKDLMGEWSIDVGGVTLILHIVQTEGALTGWSIAGPQDIPIRVERKEHVIFDPSAVRYQLAKDVMAAGDVE